MSFDAKSIFVDTINEKLSDVLTVSQMKKLNEVLRDEMNNYDVIKLTNEDCDGGDMLDIYLNALTVEGKTKATIKLYRYIISRMLKKVQTPTHKITVNTMRDYFVSEKSRGVSDRTLSNERNIYNGYFGWLCREGLLRLNPLANISAIKYEKKVKDIFSSTDIEIMKGACTCQRDVALVTFMLSTGCRVSEVCALNRNNVNFSKLECVVYGKGKKERIVYLDEVAAMFLKNYLDSRDDDDQCLFRSRLQNRISKGAIAKMLKVIESKSGVVNVHPHKFRRTLATNLIKRGMPIQDVAVILGHDKIETTMQYIVLDNSEIKHSYRKCA